MRALLAALCLVVLPLSLARADVPAPGDGGTTTKNDDKSGCSQTSGGPVGALLLAGTFSTLFLLNRKKRDA